MIYTVVGLKNQFPGTFEKDVYMFHNQEEAYASLRRNMRDLVIAEEINTDRIYEMEFFTIGEFDTDTGKFDNFEQPILMSVASMVYDLIEEEDEDA